MERRQQKFKDKKKLIFSSHQKKTCIFSVEKSESHCCKKETKKAFTYGTLGLQN